MISRKASLASWACQVTCAVILAQTLFFKFTGAPESVHIFSTLGLEPWGRIGTGIMELIAVLLLLRSRTAALGGLLAMGLMGGAILGHLTKLGIEVEGDGGLLFALACVTLVGASLVAWLRREDLEMAARGVVARVR